MKDKLIPFPTTPKSERLAERAKIVAHHFDDPEIGIKLMLFMVRKMYESFATEEAEFLELNILSRLFDLESYLSQYQLHEEDENEERDSNKTNDQDDRETD
jgi:hypothetical protein